MTRHRVLSTAGGAAAMALAALLAGGCAAMAAPPAVAPPGTPVASRAAYYDGVVIGYNTARTPGRGSAIFLHLNIGIATSGCVTLPPGELLPLLRWLNPARSPRIRMGVR